MLGTSCFEVLDVCGNYASILCDVHKLPRVHANNASGTL